MAKKSKNKKGHGGSTIALNKRATHEFLIEQRYEAGLSLEGWEVKSMRAGRAQLVDGYVLLHNNELFLHGVHISPLTTASTHIDAVPTRVRKLLMHRIEIDKLIGQVERKGYTLVATALYWKGSKAKLEIGLAKGKKTHDKRASEKDKDFQRDKQRKFRDR